MMGKELDIGHITVVITNANEHTAEYAVKIKHVSLLAAVGALSAIAEAIDKETEHSPGAQSILFAAAFGNIEQPSQED